MLCIRRGGEAGFQIINAFKDRLYVLLQNPLRWDPAEPTDDAHKQQVFDGLAHAFSIKMLDHATRRVRAESSAGLALGVQPVRARIELCASVDHWRTHLRARRADSRCDAVAGSELLLA